MVAEIIGCGMVAETIGGIVIVGQILFVLVAIWIRLHS